MAHDHNHNHDHGHGVACCGGPGHGEDSAPMTHEGLDPASASLSDALHVSFRVLSVIMLGLLAAFLLSGLFIVGPDERAVVLRFGQIVGAEDGGRGKVLGEGFHFSWPWPIDRKVKVPTSEQKARIHSFWFQQFPEDATRTLEETPPRAAGIRPGADGALMTGDKGLIHVRWACSYRVPPSDPNAILDYVSNVSRVEEVLAWAIENASIQAAATRSLEEINRTGVEAFTEQVRQRAQEILRDELATGIRISSLTMENTPPLQTLQAFNQVIIAEQQASTERTEAHRQATERLTEVAGPNALAIKEAIDTYDAALIDAQTEQAAQRYAALGQLLTAENTKGAVAEILNDAESYRVNVVERARQQQDTFARLLRQYKQNPQLFIAREWSQAAQDILGNDRILKSYVPNDVHFVLYVNQDPELIDDLRRREAVDLDARVKAEEQRRIQRARSGLRALDE